MKIKTSVMLSDDVLQEMEPYLSHYRDQSGMIECALRAFLTQLARQERDDREIAIINAHADELNREAMDVLDYQVPL